MRFCLVSEQKQTVEGIFGLNRARNYIKRELKSALLLAPFFARSLTLVPRSLLINRTETLATQAEIQLTCFFACKSNY